MDGPAQDSWVMEDSVYVQPLPFIFIPRLRCIPRMKGVFKAREKSSRVCNTTVMKDLGLG